MGVGVGTCWFNYYGPTNNKLVSVTEPEVPFWPCFDEQKWRRTN